jgi:uncharacterized protein YidB (DUF937 family)
MGLFDSIAGAIGQELQKNVQSQSPNAQIALSLINNHPGGLQGLIAQFTHAGLGEQVQSWVSTGANLPVSAQQVMQALGGQGGHLQQLAEQFGLSHDQVAGGLAEMLPSVVDQLTPNGSIQHDTVAQGLAMLKGRWLG